MFRIDSGKTSRYCDGWSRRSFVQFGVAGMASVGLPQILRAKALTNAAGHAQKDTSTILIWLDGGPSHIDTYDMKPDAPEECRGIWRPIKTNVPGIDITEMFPLQAKQADKFSLIRSLHHGTGDHFTGAHHMLTGRGGVSGFDSRGRFPFFGSILTKITGPRRRGMPAHVGVPYAASVGQIPGYFGGNFLGPAYDPFAPGGDPNAENYSVKKFDPPGTMSIEQLEDRQHLKQQFDQARRLVDSSKLYETMDRFQQEAFEMVSGPATREAFQIGKEDPKTRDLYGRHSWGQSTLLARRMVEAGSTFVSVHFGGWDNHWDLEPSYQGSLPRVDSAVAGLVQDLHDRGLLEKVLVLVMGEFGRTPKMNNGHNGQGTPGRDHWGRAISCLIAGGGVQGGRIIGATNPRGEYPAERPLKPADLHATIYHVLGVDPELRFLDQTGRPTDAIQDGNVISELF